MSGLLRDFFSADEDAGDADVVIEEDDVGVAAGDEAALGGEAEDAGGSGGHHPDGVRDAGSEARGARPRWRPAVPAVGASTARPVCAANNRPQGDPTTSDNMGPLDNREYIKDNR